MMGIMLKIIKSHNLLVQMGQGLQQEMFPEVGQGVEAVWGPGGRDLMTNRCWKNSGWAPITRYIPFPEGNGGTGRG